MIKAHKNDGVRPAHRHPKLGAVFYSKPERELRARARWLEQITGVPFHTWASILRWRRKHGYSLMPAAVVDP
jgi:hypothetical protein